MRKLVNIYIYTKNFSDFFKKFHIINCQYLRTWWEMSGVFFDNAWTPLRHENVILKQTSKEILFKNWKGYSSFLTFKGSCLSGWHWSYMFSYKQVSRNLYSWFYFTLKFHPDLIPCPFICMAFGEFLGLILLVRLLSIRLGSQSRHDHPGSPRKQCKLL